MFDFKHRVKRVLIRSYCGLHFSQIFPHSDWIRRTVVQYYIKGHKGQNSAGTRCRGFLALEYRCRGFLVLESRFRGFLSSEKTPWNHDVMAYLSSFLDVMVFWSWNLDVVVFWSWNLDVMAFWSWNLDVVAFWAWNLDVMVFWSWNLDVVVYVPPRPRFRFHWIYYPHN